MKQYSVYILFSISVLFIFYYCKIGERFPQTMIQHTQNSPECTKKHQSLSKSKFKQLIDQIELKITGPNNSTHHEESYLPFSNLKSVFNLSKRNRMLPLYVKNSQPETKGHKNQKKISINLQFNKLLLHEKKKFVQHSPNEKDLVFTLPELKIDSKKEIQTKKQNTFHNRSPRWRLNLKAIDRITFLTESNDQSLLKKNKKQLNENESKKDLRNDTNKVEEKQSQIRKFDRLNISHEPVKENVVHGRFSHKQQRGKLRKIRHNKLQKLQQKQNIQIEKINLNLSPPHSKINLKTINLEPLKIHRTLHFYKAM